MGGTGVRTPRGGIGLGASPLRSHGPPVRALPLNHHLNHHHHHLHQHHLTASGATLALPAGVDGSEPPFPSAAAAAAAAAEEAGERGMGERAGGNGLGHKSSVVGAAGGGGGGGGSGTAFGAAFGLLNSQEYGVSSNVPAHAALSPYPGSRLLPQPASVGGGGAGGSGMGNGGGLRYGAASGSGLVTSATSLNSLLYSPGAGLLGSASVPGSGSGGGGGGGHLSLLPSPYASLLRGAVPAGGSGIGGIAGSGGLGRPANASPQAAHAHAHTSLWLGARSGSSSGLAGSPGLPSHVVGGSSSSLAMAAHHAHPMNGSPMALAHAGGLLPNGGLMGSPMRAPTVQREL